VVALRTFVRLGLTMAATGGGIGHFPPPMAFSGLFLLLLLFFPLSFLEKHKQQQQTEAPLVKTGTTHGTRKKGQYCESSWSKRRIIVPRNPNKRPCSFPGCRAWAVRDTDPPLCSAHAGRNVGAGGFPGNENRRTHGFYASALRREELADLFSDVGVDTLEAEIICARIALRRVLAYLTSAGPELSLLEYTRIASVAFHGARTIARLLRDNLALGVKPFDLFDAAMNEALDELSEEWGIEL
jgi:hypothetical protein